MRLVPELLAADAEPGVVRADAVGRAARFLEVVSTALGIRAGAILLRELTGGGLECAATTLPERVTATLVDPGDRGAALGRRAIEERRAFLIRRTSDDGMIKTLRELDPAIETVAILPLADRGPVGVLVLAGDESSLATDVVRTLTPGLRLLAALVSPCRDGQAAIAGRATLEEHTRTIAELRHRVAELEGALDAARRVAAERAPLSPGAATARVEREAERTVQATAALAAAAEREDAAPALPPTFVFVDVDTRWERMSIPGHRLVAVAPGADAAARIRAEGPSRVVVNVTAPGALEAVSALRSEHIAVPAVGVLALSGADRVLGLGPLDVVARPLALDALVGAVERAAPRNARVFAAGRDADVLLKMRQALARHGHSVSMAREPKQIDELVTMVRPQVIVVDLELPIRDACELVVRAATMTPIPALVIVRADGDPTAMLHEKVRERFASGLGVAAGQWLVALAAQPIPTKPAPRHAAAPPPAP